MLINAIIYDKISKHGGKYMKIKFNAFLASIIILTTLSSCSSVSNGLKEGLNSAKSQISSTINDSSSNLLLSKSNSIVSSSQSSKAAVVTQKVSGNLKVSYIDVGQADSILITLNQHSMLIDAGNNEDGTTVVNYIKSQGVSKFDYVIGTHPHEDHIGGLDNVINTFSINTIIMPNITSTTKTFEDVLTAISNKKLKITKPVSGTTYSLDGAVITILAPNNSSYDDLNNYSVVIKLDYGKTSFIFAGDAENISESEMLSKKYNLKSDVLKVGHHGSDSSTTSNFLKAVSPKYAIISVGTGNTYGHPTQNTLNKLSTAGVIVYRTDLSGTIIATSDGNTIKFDKQASPIKPQAPPVSSIVSTVSKVASSNITSSIPTVISSGATATTSNITLVSLTSPISRNAIATIAIKGKPNTEYSIAVHYSSGDSKASGLENKVSDANGDVSWSWKIGGQTTLGTYGITISGGSQTLNSNFTVQ
jgi:competence protein ComEC